MTVGTIGQFMTKDEINQLSGNFLRFAISCDQSNFPKKVGSPRLEFSINRETFWLGLTGIYEIDHPIIIDEMHINTDGTFYVEYVILEDE